MTTERKSLFSRLRRLKALGTRHPAWREDFTLREGPINLVMGWRVTAIDASGAEFGFGVAAGWPEQAQQMAVDLAVILNALHEPNAADPDAEQQAFVEMAEQRLGDLMKWLRYIADPSYVGSYPPEQVVEIYRGWAKQALEAGSSGG